MVAGATTDTLMGWRWRIGVVTGPGTWTCTIHPIAGTWLHAIEILPGW